jgi:trans-2,3-dihydro-3-hydroxyanthranilate isomerase
MTDPSALSGARIHVVDVFAETPLAGNPLAVVISETPLPRPLRQLVAGETNLSETTFLTPTPRAPGCWAVSIHTPAAELPFAGHPVLGTAAVIREALGHGDAPLVLATGAGDVPVERDAQGVEWLAAPAAMLRPAVADGLLEALDPAFGAGPLPLATGANGPVFALVTADGPAALAAPIRDPVAVLAALRGGGCTGVLLAAPARGTRWQVRVFFDADGLREDPATGSAAAQFGEQLRAAGTTGTFELRQGEVLGRPARIRLEVPAAGPVRVGGRVRPVYAGRFT